MRRLVAALGLVVMLTGSIASTAHGYPGGPVRNVTDLAPTCASCHSSFNREQLRNEPEAFAISQVKENKHYKAIEEGIGPYKDMSPADRQKLLADVRTMDENASITLTAPSSLKPGQETPDHRQRQGRPGRRWCLPRRHRPTVSGQATQRRWLVNRRSAEDLERRRPGTDQVGGQPGCRSQEEPQQRRHLRSEDRPDREEVRRRQGHLDGESTSRARHVLGHSSVSLRHRARVVRGHGHHPDGRSHAARRPSRALVEDLVRQACERHGPLSVRREAR